MRKALVEISSCAVCPHLKHIHGWSYDGYVCGVNDEKIEQYSTKQQIDLLSLEELLNDFDDSTWINDREIPEWCPKLEKIDIEWCDSTHS